VDIENIRKFLDSAFTFNLEKFLPRNLSVKDKEKIIPSFFMIFPLLAKFNFYLLLTGQQVQVFTAACFFFESFFAFVFSFSAILDCY